MLIEEVIFIISSFYLIQSLALTIRSFKELVNQKRRIWILSTLLLSICVINFDHVYYYIEWYQDFPAFINSFIPIWFLIPPLFYHMIKIYLMEYQFKWYEVLHYLILVFVIIRLWPIYQMSPEHKLNLYTERLNDEFNYSIGHFIMLIQLAVYAIISILFVMRHLKKVRKLDSNTIYSDMVIIYRLLAVYLIYSAIVGLFIILFPNIEILKQFDGFSTLVLSGGVLWIGGWVLKNKSKVSFVGQVEHLESMKRKYSTSSLSEDQLNEIVNSLETMVRKKELFKNSDLRISDLAKETGYKTHHISQALNQSLNKSFFEFINEFRVDAIKDAMRDGKDLEQYSLTGLSANFGFKSGSSFYRIFKNLAGCTPGEFLKRQ